MSQPLPALFRTLGSRLAICSPVIWSLCLACTSHIAQAADERASAQAVVREVAPERLHVSTAHGAGDLPYFASRSLNTPAPDIERVVIVMHGHLRNADVYAKTAARVAAAAGDAATHSLWVAPQFLL